jgi:hypothetical protein
MPRFEPGWERCPTTGFTLVGDFLRFVGRLGVSPEFATREHVAEYLRDLLTRENPAQPKTVYIESGAGFSNATVQLRLTVIRLFCDFMLEEGNSNDQPCWAQQLAEAHRRANADRNALPSPSESTDQCPHRMACARCGFYRPKNGAAALFLEARKTYYVFDKTSL